MQLHVYALALVEEILTWNMYSSMYCYTPTWHMPEQALTFSNLNFGEMF